MKYNIENTKIFLIFLVISFFSIYCFVYNELIATKLNIKTSKLLNELNGDQNKQFQIIPKIYKTNEYSGLLNNEFEKIEFNTSTDLIAFLHIPKTGILFNRKNFIFERMNIRIK
jgi:hypothetical protein